MISRSSFYRLPLGCQTIYLKVTASVSDKTHMAPYPNLHLPRIRESDRSDRNGTQKLSCSYSLPSNNISVNEIFTEPSGPKSLLHTSSSRDRHLQGADYSSSIQTLLAQAHSPWNQWHSCILCRFLPTSTCPVPKIHTAHWCTKMKTDTFKSSSLRLSVQSL